MIVWTDYPILVLGDKSGQIAPIRKVELVQFDGNKYCKIRVAGVAKFVEIKYGYLYTRKGRNGEVPHVSFDILVKLPYHFADDVV